MNRHIHFGTDSISVCKECGINLRLVNTLHRNGIFHWSQARKARQGIAFINMKGVGERSQMKLNKIRIIDLTRT